MQLRATRLTAIASAVRRLFSPSSLFAAGEQGAWYDPSDISRYMSSLGPDVLINGNFEGGASGWSVTGVDATHVVTFSGGEMRYQSDTTSPTLLVRQGGLVVGKTYELVVVTKSHVSGTLKTDTFGPNLAVSSAAGTFRAIVTAQVATLDLVRATTNVDLTLESVSLRELTALDTATLFQDSAGTTPVTAVEQPVGLMLDKSKGLVLGPELVTNGDFSNGTTGWAAGAGVTIAGGVANLNVSSYAGLINTGALLAGKAYLISITISNFVSGSLRISGGGGSAENLFLPPTTGNGVFTGVIRSAGGGSISVLGNLSFQGTIDNISVRELPGNHAYQTTSTSRPVLSALYNLLTKTEDFTGGFGTAWANNLYNNWLIASAQGDAALAPDGTMTADLISFTSPLHNRLQRVTGVSPGVTYVFSLAVRAAQTGNIYGSGLVLRVASGNSGTLVNSSLATTQIAGVISESNFTVVTCTFTIPATGVNEVAVGISGAGGGSISASVFIWGASLVPANQASIPYQRVNTSTDYDADPANFKPYLKFDGVDDFLVTNSIDFTSTDKMTVFAGVRKLSDAAVGMAAELSVSSTANNGAFALFAPNAASTYALRSKGTTDALITSAASYKSPITNVLAGIGDISGDSAILRINGAQAASSAADQGTGNYGNYPLYIGRRGGTTLPFNGQLYSLIVRGAQTSDTQVSQTETWVNGKTGAY